LTDRWAAGAKTTPMQEVVLRAVRENGPEVAKRREKFLIKDWYFNPDMMGTGTEDYPYANQVRYPDNPGVWMAKPQDEWQYIWGQLVSVSDLPGIGGQNTANPPSIFDNHCMIKVNGVYYDPSYGKTWASRQEWEDQAVAGFVDPYAWFPPEAQGEAFYYFRTNPTGGPADTKEEFFDYQGGPLPYTPP
jgi:hypothetical protein